VPTRNVTLSLPEALFRRSKVYAAAHDTSLSSLVAELLDQRVGSDGFDATWRQELEFMETSPMRVGEITWTRDGLHER
jgi:hypothetical protein